MSVDCELVQILLKKLGYLEKRVNYLEGKSRNQQVMIEKLKKKLKKTTINKGKSSQVKPVADLKPELIEEIEPRQSEPLKIMKKDPKINQKLGIRMGVRCDEENQGILNPVEKRVENHTLTDKMSQIKTESIHQDAKTVKISLKRKRSVKKSHICSFCSKSFSSFSNLSRHTRVHTGERPFKCQICSKSFTQMESLKTHSRVHTGEKPYSCSVCSRAFADPSALRGHMRIHTGEKPYSCSFCFKTFAHSKTRNDHIRSHLGEKPYSCSVCSKAFVQASGLSHHKKIHPQIVRSEKL